MTKGLTNLWHQFSQGCLFLFFFYLLLMTYQLWQLDRKHFFYYFYFSKYDIFFGIWKDFTKSQKSLPPQSLIFQIIFFSLIESIMEDTSNNFLFSLQRDPNGIEDAHCIYCFWIRYWFLCHQWKIGKNWIEKKNCFVIFTYRDTSSPKKESASLWFYLMLIMDSLLGNYMLTISWATLQCIRHCQYFYDA